MLDEVSLLSAVEMAMVPAGVSGDGGALVLRGHLSTERSKQKQKHGEG